MEKINGFVHTNLYNNKISSNGIQPKYSSPTMNTGNDVFFAGLNKPYIMSKAKSEKDIPEDANIFYFCKSKVGLPEGREAKECILTEKGFSFWDRLMLPEDKNAIRLNSNNVEYVHGDSTSASRVTGMVEAKNSNIQQIDNISKIALKDDSKVSFINDVDYMDSENSTIGVANIKRLATLSGGNQVDKLKSYNIVLNPGDSVNNLESELLTCKENANNSDKFINIDKATVNIGATIAQAKVNNLNTKDLILKNSKVENLYAEDCLELENSVVDNFDIHHLRKVSDIKSKNLNLLEPNPVVQFNGNTQIDNMTIKDSTAHIFVFPKMKWDTPVNNYIKNIKVLSDYAELEPTTPRIKIQGDINVDVVEFTKKPGMVELTKRENPSKPIKVINGYITYNKAPVEPPQIEMDDI